MQKLIKYIIKYRDWLFVLMIISVALSVVQILSLRFEFNLERLHPQKDPDAYFYKEFKEKFHADIDDEYLTIAISNNKGIFEKDFLIKADSLSNYLMKARYILKVYSITRTGQIVLDGNKLKEEPLIHIDQPELYREDSVNLFRSREYVNLMMSDDGRSLVITGFNKPGLTDMQKDSLISGISEQIENLKFDASHFTSKIKVERTYVKEIERNIKRYLGLAIFFIAVVLFVIYRSALLVLIPLLAIAIALSFILAFISLVGEEVDIISSLIPPVLAVICVSNFIHIYNSYIEEKTKSGNSTSAINIAFKKTGTATFFAALTTSIGFFSLLVSNIPSVQLFGAFTGIATLISFCVSALLITSFYDKINSGASLLLKSDVSKNMMHKLFTMTSKNSFLIITAYIILFVVSLFFMLKIEINSSLLQEIPHGSGLMEDFSFIEDKFYGSRSFEMELNLKDPSNSFLEIEVLRQVEELEDFLRDSCDVGLILSPLAFIKGANKAYEGGQSGVYRLPQKQKDLEFYYQKLVLTNWSFDLVRYLTPDLKTARISGKTRDLSMKEFEQLRNKLDEFKDRNDAKFLLRWNLTGSPILIDKISYYLVNNMITGLLIAFLLVSVIVYSILKSFRSVIIVLVPNVFPLFIMGALMGLLNIPLKADTSIVFAVAFGIILDDTIHFVNRFRIEKKRGLTNLYALKRSYVSTGLSIVITTVILLSGFSVLLLSSFGGSVNVGFLVCTALISALIVDLTLLPILLLLFFKK
ncbi:MAG: MMPL family transporter [Chitinophagales bacterium]|nr:MMPL family transporter [Chitinophagales bacterium]